jgi:addiction module RelB/DinJ family antitoxin
METKRTKHRQSRHGKTVMVRLRVESQIKQKVEEILDELGLTPTQVVKILFAQIVARKEVPFRIGLPVPNKKSGPRPAR